MVKGPTCNKNGTSHQTFVVTETDLNKAAIQDQVDNMFLVNVTAFFDVAADNSSQTDPGPASLSSQSPSQSSSNPVGSTSGGACVTTRTAYSGETVTTSTVPGTQAGRGGLISTTTVYENVTVTTVTVQPSSSTSSNTAVATAASIKYTTVSVYGTTVTQTVSSSQSGSGAVATNPASTGTTLAASSSTTSTTASQTDTGAPTVTRFLDDSKPTVANKGRRALGQWGFGGGAA